MAETTQGVIPMIAYEDGVAAMDWLARAFGFIEHRRMLATDGTLAHGEMQAGSGIIMLAAPTPDYENPHTHREHCDRARRWSAVPWVIDGVLVFVDDIDTHFQRAKAAGATILSELESGGPGRRYRTEDFAGHRWMFLQRS
jgi:PhnB protein